MKKILALVLVLAFAFTLAIPAAAVIDIVAPKATVTIDANLDDAYGPPVAIATHREDDEPGATGTAWIAWDDSNLYFYVEVKDTTPNYGHSNPWETDSVEIIVDWNSNEGDDIDNDGNPYWQIRVHAAPNPENDGEQVTGGGNFVNMGGEYDKLPFANRIFDGGYAIEVAMPIALTPGSKALAEGATIKIGFQINDNQEDAGRTTMAFLMADEDTGNEWQWPHSLRGLLKLDPAAPVVVEEEPEAAGGGEAADAEIAPVLSAEPAVTAAAPKTGDGGIMALIALTAAAAAGIVVLRRKAVG